MKSTNGNGGRPHYRLPRWLEYRLYVWFDLMPNEWAVRHLEAQYRYWEALVNVRTMLTLDLPEKAQEYVNEALHVSPTTPPSNIPAPPTH